MSKLYNSNLLDRLPYFNGRMKRIVLLSLFVFAYLVNGFAQRTTPLFPQDDFYLRHSGQVVGLTSVELIDAGGIDWTPIEYALSTFSSIPTNYVTAAVVSGFNFPTSNMTSFSDLGFLGLIYTNTGFNSPSLNGSFPSSISILPTTEGSFTVSESYGNWVGGCTIIPFCFVGLCANCSLSQETIFGTIQSTLIKNYRFHIEDDLAFSTATTFSCINTGLIDLKSFLNYPTGVTWSGIGVNSNGIFDPIVSGSGTHTITATKNYENGGGGIPSASSQVVKSISVLVEDVVVDAGVDQDVCTDDGTFFLTGFSPTGGTFTGVGVASGNRFNPGSAGLGTWTLTYTYTSPNACVFTNTKDITVHNLPTVSAGFDVDECGDTGNYTLSGTPSGGVWTGSAFISGTNFNTNAAGVGVHGLTYTYTDGFGCLDTDEMTFEVLANPVVNGGGPFNFCIGSGVQNLSGFFPSGGSYSGTGITNGTQFNTAVGVGSYNVTYNYTDGSGCSNSAAANITVHALPNISLPALSARCVDASAFVLSGATPLGGTWSGNGVSSNSFDPNTAGIGTHTLTYSLTDGNGCFNSRSTTIRVNALPTITVTNPDIDVCLNGSNVSLSALPSGGSWAGPGVSGNSFNPSLVGTGSHDLFYTYTDGNGCINSGLKEIRVNNTPNVDAENNLRFCINAGLIDFSSEGSPNGGTWTGTGISSNFFNPIVAGVGTHTLTYTVNNGGTGCSDSDTKDVIVDPVPSVSVSPTAQVFCVDELPFNLLGGSPGGGTWTGLGVSGNMFNPGGAGVGVHSITYTVVSGNGCTNSTTRAITVNSLPVIAVPSDFGVCDDTGLVGLIATPAGGVWSGSAFISGTNFNSDTAPPADYDLTYTVVDANGCQNTDVFTLEILINPTVSTGQVDREFCIDDLGYVMNGVPSGGTFSGSGISGSTFTASVAGNGVHPITYTFTNLNGCTDFETVQFTVRNVPTVDAGGDLTSCAGDSNFALTGQNPVGGSWSGSGVNGSNFDPGNAGVGTHLITYTFSDGFGCSNNDLRQIEVFAEPVVFPGSDFNICQNSGLITLSDGTPSGGVYSGIGVVGNTFNTDIVAGGNYDITYSFTNANGCSDSDTREITVLTPENVDAGDDVNVCVVASAFTLSGGIPVGGTWTSLDINGQAAISGTSFDPVISGVGSFNLTYTSVGANGCTNTDDKLVIVTSIPTVNAGADLEFCEHEGAVFLSGQVTPGGNWFGPAVANNVFSPALLGTGSYTLSYLVTDGNGCDGSDDITAIVYSVPIVAAGSNQNICINSGNVTLTGQSPAGGVWMGSGISGVDFNPSVAGLGTHTLTYRYVDGNGCSVDDTKTVTVTNTTIIDAGVDLAVCINDSPFAISGASINGGTWSGTGVSGNVFDPVSAGLGLHLLIYDYVNLNGCSTSDTKFVTVNNIDIVAAGNSIQLCSNDGLYNLNADVNIIGGVFSGNGVQGSNFDPSTSGVGNNIITYNYANGNGCVVSDTRTITVINPATVDGGVDFTVCISDGAVDMSGDPNILGGIYSGAGVVADSFDPRIVTAGNYVITYTIDDINGCSTSDTRTVFVVSPGPVDAGNNLALCSGAGIIDLNDFVSPQGGAFVGTGITGSNFDPSSSGNGSHVITYTITDGFGCNNSDQLTITVTPSLSVDAGPDFTLCENGDALDLNTRVDLIGGSFVGTGVAGTVFNPSNVSPGTYSITYNFTNEFNCTDADQFNITVTSLENVSAGSDLGLCLNQDPRDVSIGAFPGGGVFYGAGINGKFFDPIVAGIGDHELLYEYSDINGCVVFDTKEVTVNDLPAISAGNNITLCIDADLYDLDADVSPLGGVWSGTGVDISNFNPLIAGSGIHELTYTFTQANG